MYINSKDETSRTPLLWAATEGHEAIVRLLLGAGAQVDSADSQNLTPLSWAARKGHEAVARLLLDAGAQVDWEDNWTPQPYPENIYHDQLKANNGHTPLLWAAREGHEAIAKLLVNAGAQIDWKDS
ncbi:hypothetical protein THAR02_04925 [Trichoderma harzianum]|uniref:Uncharacterized protein n=1 Tax=Trichoderma harzianum TaxID=5544 RepID=A0A0G0AD71_TRIHA|nr:hypothetical protein THAR02_04925 [Trichoderma harzianum]